MLYKSAPCILNVLREYYEFSAQKEIRRKSYKLRT